MHPWERDDHRHLTLEIECDDMRCGHAACDHWRQEAEVARMAADAAYNQGYRDGVEDNRSGCSVEDLEAEVRGDR